MLDEYRCEAAVSPEFLAANDVMSVQPDGWPAVESLFTRARRDYRLTGDLGAAYAGVLTALDRFASFAGYAVASIAGGRYTRHQWSDAPAVLLVDDLLLDVVGADVRLRAPDVLAMVTLLVPVVAAVAYGAGFEITVNEQKDELLLFLLD